MGTVTEDNGNLHSTSILDLSIDSIVHCASFLYPKDLASMAITCKHLRDAVYCDSIWEYQCRKRWPPKQAFGKSFQFCGGKKAYEERLRASQKFEFFDPVELRIKDFESHTNQILLENNFLYATKGPSILGYDLESPESFQLYSGHNAQITSLRSVPSTGLLSLRYSGGGTDPVLITSSMDHTIRLWRKCHNLRTLRGHSGPVATLSDSLLGSQYGRHILASGGMDGTIRLWTLAPGQKRGSSPLLKTFHGHELAVKQLIVTEYNPSLLLSAGKDSKLRVWDVTTASTGSLVGSVRGPGVPVSLACRGSVCYIAGGSTLMLVDLRSMQTVATVAAHNSRVLSFFVRISGDKVCTGGADKIAKLWDLRNMEDPYAILGGHQGDVNFVHMDHYKVVTGGPNDTEVYVWDCQTGDQINSLDLSSCGLTALTVQGTHMAIGSSDGSIQYRDYSNCAVSIRHSASDNNDKEKSKFWETSFMDDRSKATNDIEN